MFRLLVHDRKLDKSPPNFKAHGGLPAKFETASSIRLFRRPYDERTSYNTVATLALPADAFDMAELFKFEEQSGDSASSNSRSTLSLCTAVSIMKLHHSDENETAPSTAMAVFRFVSSEAAATFFHHNHGREITLPNHNESERQKVHTLQLLVIDGLVDDSKCSASTADGTSESIASLLSLTNNACGSEADAIADSSSSSSSSASASPGAAALEAQAHVEEESKDWVELPSCPACLDRLDGSVSGVLGYGVCSHQSLMVDLASQRCNCWASLNLSLCPACSALQAYSQDSSSGGGANSNMSRRAVAAEEDQRSTSGGGSSSAVVHEEASEEGGATTIAATGSTAHSLRPVECAVCGVVSRLWTCLVCGFVGCGRYTAEHSLRHSRSSGHRWAMELGSRRVWDYFEDTYAHRLPGVHAQPSSYQAAYPLTGARGDVRDLAAASGSSVGGGRNLDKGVKAAGHMMQELNGFASGDFGDQEVSVKLGALALEYESLLTTQLSEQRRYFERLLAKEEAAGLAAAAEAGASSSQLSEMEALRQSCAALEAEHGHVAEALRHEEAILKESRNKQASLLAQQRATEREARRTQATVAVEQRQVEDAVAELQQQVTELTFYARTVKEVGASPNKAEIQEGQVLVANDNSNSSSTSRGKGNNRSGRKSGGGRRH